MTAVLKRIPYIVELSLEFLALDLIIGERGQAPWA
jgi:hypothetical protein